MQLELELELIRMAECRTNVQCGDEIREAIGAVDRGEPSTQEITV